MYKVLVVLVVVGPFQVCYLLTQSLFFVSEI